MDYWGEIDLLSVLQQRGLVPTIAGSVVSVVLYVRYPRIECGGLQADPFSVQART